MMLGSLTCLFAGDYIIGTGTGNQNYVPFYGGSNYGWSRFFFTADELLAAGMTGTVQITKIGFQLTVNTFENYITNDQRIYIREFYDETYPSTPQYVNPSDYPIAYQGTISWTSPGWIFIQLTNPYSYTYNGGSPVANGIEILWENRDGSAQSPYPRFTFTQTSNNTAAYKYNNASFPTGSGTRTKSRPNVWFVSPATTVPNPAINPLPANEANGVEITTNLKWTSGGGDPNDYLVSLYKTNPLTYIVNNQATISTTYTLPTLLDYSTTYYWRVIPRNSFGNAVACPTWSFTTKADPSIMTYPWTETFDGITFPPTSDWLRKGGDLVDPIQLVGSSLWEQDDWLNITGTDKAARINIWGPVNGWLITPQFLFNEDSDYLSFDLARLKCNQTPDGTPPDTTGIDDRFAVLISDGYTWSTSNIVREWNNSGSPYVLNNISLWGERICIPLNGLTGHKKIAFFAGSTTSNADSDFMINNLYVGPIILSAPEVQLSQTGDNNCVLSWHEISGATGYNIYSSDLPSGPWNFVTYTTDINYQFVAETPIKFFQVKAVNRE
jgi:hypothetical protein